MNQKLIISMMVIVVATAIIIEGLMAYDAGRQSIVREMQAYGCEKVLGYILK